MGSREEIAARDLSSQLVTTHYVPVDTLNFPKLSWQLKTKMLSLVIIPPTKGTRGKAWGGYNVYCSGNFIVTGGCFCIPTGNRFVSALELCKFSRSFRNVRSISYCCHLSYHCRRIQLRKQTRRKTRDDYCISDMLCICIFCGIYL